MVEKRRMGDSTIEVAPLALGGNVFDWTADEQASFAVLDAFVDAGGNMIDTADVYSAWVPGHTTNALPNGAGVLVHRGAKIVMQVHYNLIAASGPDRSSAQLRLRRSGPDRAECGADDRGRLVGPRGLAPGP